MRIHGKPEAGRAAKARPGTEQALMTSEMALIGQKICESGAGENAANKDGCKFEVERNLVH